MMKEMPIVAISSGKAPDYNKTASLLLQDAREFFRDPENEKAYQEWKKKKTLCYIAERRDELIPLVDMDHAHGNL